uniref:Uncharacterized protein n=1 Tax=Plectus sambesii TaxID=2011161 RepID=A0A914VH71_9BILA
MGGATVRPTRAIAPLYSSANSYKQQSMVFFCAFIAFLLLSYGALIVYLVAVESREEVGGKLRIVWVTPVTANDTADIGRTLHLLSAISSSLSEYFRFNEVVNWMVVEERTLTGSISHLANVRLNFMHLRADADDEQFGGRLCRLRAIERLRQLWTEEEELMAVNRGAVAIVLTNRLQEISDDCLSQIARRAMRRAARSDRPIPVCESLAVAIGAQSIVSNRQSDALLAQYFHS